LPQFGRQIAQLTNAFANDKNCSTVGGLNSRFFVMANLNGTISQLDKIVVDLLGKTSAMNASVKDVQAARNLQAEVRSLNNAVRSLLLISDASVHAVDVAANAYRIRGATDMMLYQIECIINPTSFGFGPLQALINSASQVFSLQAVECTRLALCGELGGFHLVIKKHLGA
jgi:hypothetical protein